MESQDTIAPHCTVQCQVHLRNWTQSQDETILSSHVKHCLRPVLYVYGCATEAVKNVRSKGFSGNLAI